MGLPNTHAELDVKHDDGDVRLYHMVFESEGKNYCVEFDSKSGSSDFFQHDTYQCMEVKKTFHASYSWVSSEENLYFRHTSLRDDIAVLNKEKLGIEGEMYVKHMDGIKAKGLGTYSRNDGDFKFNCTTKEIVKIDQKLASVNPELFRVKYELDKKLFDALPNAEKVLVMKAMTTTPSKPAFKVEHIQKKEA